MPSYKFDCLARDKVAAFLKMRGIEVQTRTLSGVEWLALLKKKLADQAQEIVQTTSRDELIEELGDVQEVTAGLCAAYKKAKLRVVAVFMKVAF